jgi:hypothetical protein
VSPKRLERAFLTREMEKELKKGEASKKEGLSLEERNYLKPREGI